MARVKLNGTDLGIVWRPPFRVDLGNSAQPGVNTLEVMVVNSWCNRLIGDASLPENQRLTKTNIRVEKPGRQMATRTLRTARPGADRPPSGC